MTAGLNELRAALDSADAPLTVFFRNDDAGWAEEALHALLAVAAKHGATIDLAAIPSAMTQAQASRLRAFIGATGAARVHQHGFSHQNHEAEGKKCEFGASRPMTRQWADIRSGRERLHDFFPDGVDPIFTPPWNRCVQETVEALHQEGFLTLSRDAAAAPLALGRMAEIPVDIDWRRADSAKDSADNVGLPALTARIRNGAARIGVMTHHATIDSDLLDQFGAAIGVLADSRRVSFSTMIDFIPIPARKDLLSHV
ncbi:MAG: hypothetical protein AAB227_09965 [Pseudomonadota bacterium]